ncbi:hypothetical protein KUTeg_020414 [Tegillarca granosa]|uniref:VWFA domain-containing protein n=1 Tax=Tegillarca granosa TaxID=220873 RepID=A0ABQ9EC09_TEGGR|nr:hypothetical protein KUTeg_020414 [Tegillarca granosa]
MSEINMATMGYQRFNVISAIFFVCFTFYAQTGSSKEIPINLETVGSSWVTALDNNLTIHMQNAPLFTVINSYFQSDSNSGITTDLRYEVVDSQKLVKKMSLELAEMLNRKKLALTRLVEVAEDAAANYTWDGTLTKDTDVIYYNSKDLTILKPLLGKGGKRFEDKDINATISSVHIPVEIYEGDIDILNGLKWSEKLDAVFKENYENDSEILWQYFGSQTGFMRTFPASLWGTPSDAVDLYDVRRRPWYTQGSSSPKDMLILIDRSGSVHGQSLQLIKVAVKSILDTLGENDFVKIVQFSKTAENVSCFDKFVQANYRNKMILSKAVDKLVAKEMANFQVGLTKAFDDFDELDRGNFSARCNRMIMLLTDGGTDSAEAVYKERNWSREESKQIRVFTYAVDSITSKERRKQTDNGKVRGVKMAGHEVGFQKYQQWGLSEQEFR